MAVGVVIALVVAAFATMRLSETYSATAQVLVTQQGFPVGRTNLVDPNAPLDKEGNPIPSYADPSRFEYLAQVYARLAVSDVVKHRVLGRNGVDRGKILILDGGKTRGSYTATVDATDTRALPFILLVSQAASGREAREIALRATAALQAYITSSQTAADIRGKDRVELQVIAAPTKAKLTSGRPLILPVAIFVLIVGAAAAVAFFRENVSRTKQAVPKPLIPEKQEPVAPPLADEQPSRLDISPKRVATLGSDRTQGTPIKRPRQPPAAPARPDLRVSGGGSDDGVAAPEREQPAFRDVADNSGVRGKRAVAKSQQAPREAP
jgi:hypothetical protein